MKDLYDLEERIFHHRSKHSRSKRQRDIRRALRNLGMEVGRGRRYNWTTSRELDKIVRRVRGALPP